MKVLGIIALVVVGFTLGACSKKKSSGIATAPINGYYLSGNTCYNNQNGQADYASCAALQYYIQGNQCLGRANQVPIDMSYCTTLQYFYVNGQCYQRSPYQIAQPNSCNIGGGGQYGYYQLQGGRCIDTRTGIEVSYQLCQQGGGGYGQGCYGYHIWFDDWGDPWEVMCDGQVGYGNCSGYELIDGRTGQYVYCR